MMSSADLHPTSQKVPAVTLERNVEGLHIGMVSWDFDPSIGGMGRHVGTLTEGLRQAGLTVSVFSGSDVQSVGLGRSVAFSFVLPFRLGRWIAARGVNLLHVHTGPGGAMLLRRAGVPLVVTANHTYWQQHHLPGERWKRLLLPLERRTYALANRVISISADTARIVERVYGVPSSRLSVIPCGFPLAPFEAEDMEAGQRPLHVVFVGRPDTRKGWDLLQAAWRDVHARLPSAVLDVVGFTGSKQPGIRFHGRLTDAEHRSLVGRSRLAVCPSRFEGFGLSAAEAIASGTPVVATDSDGLRTVVEDRKTGLLISPVPSQIASGILAVLTDDALFERLHKSCRIARHRFTDKAEIASHLALYRALHSGMTYT
ncbi:MAG: glycosyltransferase family 4 protein [Candidatus Peribacteraceae bacterium]